MKVNHIRKVEEKLGVASTLKADFINYYRAGVEKFLRDNQKEMGDKWVEQVGSILYNFQGKNKEADILGSSPYILTAMQTFCPDIHLITGKQLLELYNLAGNKNPFGAVYIDFGIQANGEPKTNHVKAKALLESYKHNGINTDEVLVPDFCQLNLVPDKEGGLVFKLKDGVTKEALTPASEYPFGNRIRKNGLFRVYLDGGDACVAHDDGLAGSTQDGRVVCYDAEGVELKKYSPDTITQLSTSFLSKFQ